MKQPLQFGRAVTLTPDPARISILTLSLYLIYILVCVCVSAFLMVCTQVTKRVTKKRRQI